jgi:hypothetical protein
VSRKCKGGSRRSKRRDGVATRRTSSENRGLAAWPMRSVVAFNAFLTFEIRDLKTIKSKFGSEAREKEANPSQLRSRIKILFRNLSRARKKPASRDNTSFVIFIALFQRIRLVRFRGDDLERSEVGPGSLRTAKRTRARNSSSGPFSSRFRA